LAKVATHACMPIFSNLVSKLHEMDRILVKGSEARDHDNRVILIDGAM